MEIPDEMVRDIKIFAAREGLKLKDVIARSLRRTLDEHLQESRKSLRKIRPVDAGRIFPGKPAAADRLGDMLDERGHRY